MSLKGGWKTGEEISLPKQIWRERCIILFFRMKISDALQEKSSRFYTVVSQLAIFLGRRGKANGSQGWAQPQTKDSKLARYCSKAKGNGAWQVSSILVLVFCSSIIRTDFYDFKLIAFNKTLYFAVQWQRLSSFFFLYHIRIAGTNSMFSGRGKGEESMY